MSSPRDLGLEVVAILMAFVVAFAVIALAVVAFALAMNAMVGFLVLLLGLFEALA